MKLSVIIPALNESENLYKLVPYLLDCGTEIDLEILIAHASQSQEDLSHLAYKYDCQIISCPKTSRAHQMNWASKFARGTVLYFVHADTLPPNTFVKDIRSALGRGNIMGLFKYQFDSRRGILKANAYCTGFKNLFIGGGDQTLFILKSAFLKLEGFNEYFCIMEDFDFFRRAKNASLAYEILQSKVTVSARKYYHNSYLRVTIANFIVFSMFKFGIKPKRLQKTYQSLLK